jgi:hypothetical protein
MTAAELFFSALLRLRPFNDFLGNFLTLWLSPEVHIHPWFAGENDKMRAWDFHVADEDAEKFLTAIPSAEKLDHKPNYGAIYRVRVEKLDKGN